MSAFVPYRPGERGEPLPGVSVRAAEPRDVPAMARLVVQRLGGDLDQAAASFRDELRRIAGGSSRRQLCVAEASGAVVGFGRSLFLPTDEIEGARGMPAGWYLMGLQVDADHRRRGVGRAITRHRIARLAEVADAVYYFANADNGASIDLHGALGFVEITREFEFPGTTFTGGVGVMFGLRLR